MMNQATFADPGRTCYKKNAGGHIRGGHQKVPDAFDLSLSSHRDNFFPFHPVFSYPGMFALKPAGL
jgi:hypothetical protein